MINKALVVFLVSFLLILTATVSVAVEFTSVRPTVVNPGDIITVSFAGAEPPIYLLIGGQVLQAEEVASGFLSYRITDIQAGNYIVRFRVDDNIVATPFQLTVLEAVPSILSLSPSNIPECAEIEEKQIEVFGRNFLAGSRLLVNGSLVLSKVLTPQHIVFDASALNAGVYGVQVVNPSGKKSLPFSLYINSVPIIDEISVGDNFTNYYELVIRGGNFFQQSTLLVNEAPPGLIGIRPRQKIVWGQGRRVARTNQINQDQGDYLYYQDCHTLIYYRFPASGQKNDLTFKVINPDGKASGAYQLLAN